MSLRYPVDAGSGNADMVAFRHMEYTSRQSGGGGSVGGNIQLYMPESTPTVQNSNAWGDTPPMYGPMGKAQQEGVALLADTVMNSDVRGGLSREDMDDLGSKVRKYFDGLGSSSGAMGRQAGMNIVSKITPMSPNQVLSTTQGTIYNPNIELAYDGPRFRNFTFSFKFVPKSAAEAEIVNAIILEFKRWSAPQATEGSMYEIPHVWQVSYMSGGGQNRHYNQFKPAALMAVSVTENAGLPAYAAHEGGAPIVTDLQLGFKEVDMVTRDDHTGGRGF